MRRSGGGDTVGSRIPLRRPWGVLAVAAVAPASMAWVGWGLVWSGGPGSGEANLPLAVVLLAMGAYLFWTPLSDLLTRFTEEGITKPTLLGPVTVRWADVTSVEMDARFGQVVKVATPTRTVRINTLLFSERGEPFRTIRRHAPASAISPGLPHA